MPLYEASRISLACTQSTGKGYLAVRARVLFNVLKERTQHSIEHEQTGKQHDNGKNERNAMKQKRHSPNDMATT